MIKDKNFKKVVIILLLIIIIFSSVYLIQYFYDMYISKKQSNLLNEITISDIQNSLTENNVEESIVVPLKSERILKLEELRKENEDIVGWVEIENTEINYPVLQADDNDFYMNHNYKGEKSSAGSIFLDKDYDFNLPSSNLLIYGHNMKNNTMFQNLLKFSAFYSKVYYKTDKNVFRYYNFVNASSEEDYNNFVGNVKKASLYDTGINVNFGDKLITLSTCSYHTTDGRFVVVGRKKD